jgi:tetratricopeptide (TPR) repeat protein
VIILFLVLVTAGMYGKVVRYDFINFDDPDYVQNNHHVFTGLSLANAGWAFTSTSMANWHPLTWLSLQLDGTIWHRNPAGYHATNVLLHILATVLLYVALRRMTAAVWPSAAVAALFAFHPLHVESVAWISERKDVLSTVFWMLTLWAYARYVERPGWKRYLWVAVFLAMGLMAKPMLVTLPLVLLLLDVWPLGRLRLWKADTPGAGAIDDAAAAARRRSLGRLVLEKAPLLALALASSIVTAVVQRGAMSDADALSLDIRLANAALSYAAYLGKAVWPSGLVAFYPYPTGVETWQWLGAAVIVAVITVAVLLAARRRPYLAVGWLWFLGTLVPVIGLVQVGLQGMADRYTYVPLIGLFIMVAWGMADLVAAWPRARRTVMVGAWLILAACVVASQIQIGYWKNSITLFGHALACNERNPVAHLSLGQELNRLGDAQRALSEIQRAIEIYPGYVRARSALAGVYVSQKDFAAAERVCREAIMIRPDFADAHNNLGVALLNQGHYDSALEEFEKALTLNPDLADAYSSAAMVLLRKKDLQKAADYSRRSIELEGSYAPRYYVYAEILSQQGRREEAIEVCRQALAVKPDFAEAHLLMALRLAELNRLDEAADHLREAIRISPDHPDWFVNLGTVLGRQGKWAEVLAAYRAAVSLKSGDPKPYNDAAWILATSANPSLRNGKEAVALAEQACTLTDRKDPNTLETLAAAYAEAGRFPEAVTTAKAAIALATSLGRKDEARQIQDRLKLFQARQPYHEPAL